MLTIIHEEQIIKNKISLRDFMANYFRNNSPVRVVIDDRWVRDDRSHPAEYLQ